MNRLAAVFLLLAVFAAPAAAQDQPDTTWVRTHYTKREVRIPMRDGVHLYTVIYEPTDRSRKYPILLNRSPYSSAPYGEGAMRTAIAPSETMMKEGYIVVYQDVRGKFMSEGEFVNMTPHRDVKRGKADIDESSDTYDTIDWLVKNVANNNGRVGTWGISYPGFYTAAGMIGAHPAHRAASPQAPITDWFQGDDFGRNGGFWLPHFFWFFGTFGRPRPEPTTQFPQGLRPPTPDGYDFFLNRLVTLKNVNAFYHDSVAFWNELRQHPTYDAWWQARNLRPHLRDIRPAVLTVGGIFDAENIYGALQVYKTVERNSPRTDNRFVFGPWFHGQWARGTGDGLGAVSFGSRTSEFYRDSIEAPFFACQLKQQCTKPIAEATVFETGTNVWRRYDAWPPKGATSATIYLREDGALSFDAPANADATAAGGFDEYVSDPNHPVPFIDWIAPGMPREYMTADQRHASRRPDVLVYRTEPLTEDITVVGPVSPSLWVSTTGTDSDWIVKLIDVYPDTTSDLPNMIPGQHLAGYQQLVRGEVMRGRFRNSFEKPEAFEPGKPTKVEWSMNDVSHTFRKGHRIMVQLQSTWFPLLDRNPQQFINIQEANPEDFRAATQRLYHSGSMPSQLRVLVNH